MKKVFKYLKYLIPAIFIIIAFVAFYEPALSKDQKNTIKLFGYPTQFVITYLPRGEADNPQLVRNETWFYPRSNMKISFLGGNFVYEEEYAENENIEETILKPQDFDFFLTYEDLEDMFGIENIIPIDFLPVLYEKDQTATYLSDKAIFIIESDHLTYFQTVGLGEEGLFLEDIVEEEPLEEKTSMKTYQNTELKMRIKYPADWFLEDNNVVLSTYDTGYMEKGLELPERRLKCDFFSYDDSDIEIDDKEQIIDEHVSVYEGKAKSDSDEGPGLGDAHMFLFKQSKKESIGLLCYAYDEKFYSNLLEMLETFEFID